MGDIQKQEKKLSSSKDVINIFMKTPSVRGYGADIEQKPSLTGEVSIFYDDALRLLDYIKEIVAENKELNGESYKSSDIGERYENAFISSKVTNPKYIIINFEFAHDLINFITEVSEENDRLKNEEGVTE